MVSPSFSARRSSAPAVTAVCSSSPVALTSSDSGAQGFVIPGKLDQFLDGTLGDGVFGDGITEKNRAVLVYSGLPGNSVLVNLAKLALSEHSQYNTLVSRQKNLDQGFHHI